MESGHLDAKSQIYGSFRCFSFVSSSSLPPSSISCGDLSFPAGPMLISYWSSGLRVGVCEMGKGEHDEEKCGGIWVQAKNSIHLYSSQLLCADFKNVSMLVEVKVKLKSYISQKTWSTGAADSMFCSRAPQQ